MSCPEEETENEEGDRKRGKGEEQGRTRGRDGEGIPALKAQLILSLSNVGGK